MRETLGGSMLVAAACNSCGRATSSTRVTWSTSCSQPSELRKCSRTCTPADCSRSRLSVGPNVSLWLTVSFSAPSVCARSSPGASRVATENHWRSSVSGPRRPRMRLCARTEAASVRRPSAPLRRILRRTTKRPRRRRLPGSSRRMRHGLRCAVPAPRTPRVARRHVALAGNRRLARNTRPGMWCSRRA